MKQTELRCYLAPEIEVLSIYAEMGFSASSPQQLPNYEEDDDIIIIG